MRGSYAASLAIRRAIGRATNLWPSIMLEARREAPQAMRIVARIPVKVADREILIPAANIYHLQRFQWMADGLKEPNTQKWIKETLREGDVFLDVGANVGIFSALAAVVAPKAKIYAFEPELQSAAALAELVAINRLPVTVFAAAVGKQTSASTFHINTAMKVGLSDHQLTRAIGQDGKEFVPVATIGTMVASIDDLVKWGAITQPTHIKIDVDGQDEAVLEGARETLRVCRWVGIECAREQAGDMFTKLRTLGFEPSAAYSYFNAELTESEPNVPRAKQAKSGMIFGERR